MSPGRRAERELTQAVHTELCAAFAFEDQIVPDAPPPTTGHRPAGTSPALLPAQQSAAAARPRSRRVSVVARSPTRSTSDVAVAPRQPAPGPLLRLPSPAEVALLSHALLAAASAATSELEQGETPPISSTDSAGATSAASLTAEVPGGGGDGLHTLLAPDVDQAPPEAQRARALRRLIDDAEAARSALLAHGRKDECTPTALWALLHQRSPAWRHLLAGLPVALAHAASGPVRLCRVAGRGALASGWRVALAPPLAPAPPLSRPDLLSMLRLGWGGHCLLPASMQPAGRASLPRLPPALTLALSRLLQHHLTTLGEASAQGVASVAQDPDASAAAQVVWGGVPPVCDLLELPAACVPSRVAPARLPLGVGGDVDEEASSASGSSDTDTGGSDSEHTRSDGVAQGRARRAAVSDDRTASLPADPDGRGACATPPLWGEPPDVRTRVLLAGRVRRGAATSRLGTRARARAGRSPHVH